MKSEKLRNKLLLCKKTAAFIAFPSEEVLSASEAEGLNSFFLPHLKRRWHGVSRDGGLIYAFGQGNEYNPKLFTLHKLRPIIKP